MGDERDTGASWWKKIMPWGVSIILHVCLALVLAVVLFQSPPSDSGDGRVVSYAADSLPRRVEPKPVRTTMADQSKSGDDASTEVMTGLEPRWEGDDGAEGQDPVDPVSGAEGDEAIWNELEREPVSPSDLPTDELTERQGTPRFFGAETRGKDIVYVIDSSASLKGKFDEIRGEMLHSIAQLGEDQRFQIVLFAGGRPRVGPGRGLVTATRKARSAAAKFLSRVEPTGRTHPVPALNRAFASLNRGGRRTRLICLLTDGAFPDSARVVRTIKKLNSRGYVRINTYLYGESGASTGALPQIARDNDGTFVRVGNR